MRPLRSLIGAVLVVALAFLFVLDGSIFLFLSDAFFYSPERLEHKFGGTRVVIVSASSGIGAELARQLCTQTTANVILIARRAEKLEEVARTCTGPPPMVVPLDVTGNETEAVMQRVVQESDGGIDSLILNAGIFLEVPTLEVEIEKTRDLIELNLMSQIRVATSIIKSDGWETKHKGHIAITSSLAGKLGTPVSAAYTASKHGLHGYFNSLRSELTRLRVDIICPGPVATPIFVKSNRAEDKRSISETMPGAMMSEPRAAQLFLSAMVARPAWLFQETWIARGLPLLVTYLGQYAPVTASLVRLVLDPIIMDNFNNGLGFGFGFLDSILSLGQR